MTFKRLLYLVSQGPRVIRLFQELWKVLIGTSDEQLLEYIQDIERVTDALKKSKTHEEKADVALRISGLLRKL